MSRFAVGQMVLESISSGLQPDALPSKLLPRSGTLTCFVFGVVGLAKGPAKLGSLARSTTTDP